MKIQSSPTREKYPLSEKKIIKKTITTVLGTITSLFFLSIVFVPVLSGILTALPNVMVIWDFIWKWLPWYPVLFATVVLLIYFYQRWYFAVYYYDSTDNFLVIRKGPITPKEITVPWERIQDVYVDQDLFDRMLGLYDVHISTATITSGIEAHIDGVERMAADGLRELLLGKVKSRISRGIA